MTDKQFSKADQDTLLELMMHRRDVRGNRFVDREIDQNTLDQILGAVAHSPSVGFSQPWEFVIIKDMKVKQAVADIFEHENAKAKELFQIVDKNDLENTEQKSNRAEQYAQLKLEGILAAPINIAVFYTPSKWPVLGQTSMHKAGEYSVVCAVQNMWLMSRALNVGMGWVSILNADKVKNVLNAPSEHELVAYLCLGHVDHFLDKPELEILEWERRKSMPSVIVKDKYS